MPQRERYLFVCTNRRSDDDPRGSCAARGSEEIVKKLKAKLAELGAAKDVARVCSTSCLDLCDIGVAIAHEPNHVSYGGVTLADVPDIAKAVAEGGIVARLVKYPAASGAEPVQKSP